MGDNPGLTDPEYEDHRGRMAFWLDPEELEYLAERCICGRNAKLELARAVPRRVLRENELLRQAGGEPHDWQCKMIRWRANVALFRAGLADKPHRS